MDLNQDEIKPMGLKELEELKDYNELDLLVKLIEIAESAKKRTEKVLRGNKSAGVDVRKAMQDIRLLSEIIRDEIQRRKFKGKKLEVKVSPYNKNYIMYYLEKTMILSAWKYSDKSNFVYLDISYLYKLNR